MLECRRIAPAAEGENCRGLTVIVNMLTVAHRERGM
jgi:hypothetical protein